MSLIMLTNFSLVKLCNHVDTESQCKVALSPMHTGIQTQQSAKILLLIANVPPVMKMTGYLE